MAQISPFSAQPDRNLHISGALKSGSGNTAQKTTATNLAPVGDEAQASPLQGQLTHLNAVLSSLQKNASSNRAQYVEAFNRVKAGTYAVDPLDVSRSIISDLLTKQ